MTEILDYAERRTRARIAELPDGTHAADDVLEGDVPADERDIPLRVSATIDGDELRLDFTGTDPQVEGNLNCPLSVTKSAAFFAVRVLTDPDAPPSAGALRPVQVLAPAGSLLNAQPPAAVAAGNVETSSRVADLVFDALGQATPAPAQGQGTMNNLDPGRAQRFTYYETPAAARAPVPRRRRAERRPRGDVEHAQHSRRGAGDRVPAAGARARPAQGQSAGDGRHRGGDGIVREIEALEPMRFTLITERRRHAPRGRDGGADGLARAQPAQRRAELPSKAEGELRPSDRLRIETPGGGGYGAAR